jgi:zinc transport system ATP-binding protein
LNTQSAIEVSAVSFTYGGPWVLKEVSLTVERGEFIGIVGPNGGGKTTLLKLMLGLLKPTSGRIVINGHPPTEARHVIGYVPQVAKFPRDFPVSVEEVVLLGRLGKTRWMAGFTAKDRAVAERAMDAAEILPLRTRRLANLSGGQFQRMLIARALTTEPEILILDEPAANLDLRAEKDTFDLLKQLEQQQTIIVVSHDIGFISQYVARVACLNQTLICHATQDISGELIEQLYGRPVRMIQHVH